MYYQHLVQSQQRWWDFLFRSSDGRMCFRAPKNFPWADSFKFGWFLGVGWFFGNRPVEPNAINRHGWMHNNRHPEAQPIWSLCDSLVALITSSSSSGNMAGPSPGSPGKLNLDWWLATYSSGRLSSYVDVNYIHPSLGWYHYLLHLR